MSQTIDSPYLYALDLKGPVQVMINDTIVNNLTFYYRESMPLRTAVDVFMDLGDSSIKASKKYIAATMLDAEGNPHNYIKDLDDAVLGHSMVVNAVTKALQSVGAGGMEKYLLGLDDFEIQNKRKPPKGVKQQAPQRIVSKMMPKGFDKNIMSVMLLTNKSYYEVLQMEIALFRLYYEIDLQVKNNPSEVPGSSGGLF